MNSVILITHGGSPPDRWKFAARSIQEFWVAESNTALGEAFMRWLAKRPTNKKRTFDPFRGDMSYWASGFGALTAPASDTGTDLVEACTYYVDVTNPEPPRFVIRVPNLPAMYVGDVPNPLLRRILMMDFVVCRGARRPYYHEIEQGETEGGLTYRRLLLPVIGENAEVSKIYAFCRPTSEPPQTKESQQAIMA